MGDKKFIPDLTDYKRAILLYNTTIDAIKEDIKKYADICGGAIKAECKFYMAHIPGDDKWIYLEFPYTDGVAGHWNFYNYQNLMLWLEDVSKKFCLAIPRNQKNPIFFSVADTKNTWGDSVMGIFKNRDFYFTVPGEKFTWQSGPEEFDFHGYIKDMFGFDTKLLPDIVNYPWEELVVTLYFDD